MAVLLRRDKGEELTHNEVDDNWVFLDKKIVVEDHAPTADDDASKGHAVTKSVWFDTTASLTYKLTDSSVGAAVWEELGLGGGAVLPKYTLAESLVAGSIVQSRLDGTIEGIVGSYTPDSYPLANIKPYTKTVFPNKQYPYIILDPFNEDRALIYDSKGNISLSIVELLDGQISSVLFTTVTARNGYYGNPTATRTVQFHPDIPNRVLVGYRDGLAVFDIINDAFVEIVFKDLEGIYVGAGKRNATVTIDPFDSTNIVYNLGSSIFYLSLIADVITVVNSYRVHAYGEWDISFDPFKQDSLLVISIINRYDLKPFIYIASTRNGYLELGKGFSITIDITYDFRFLNYSLDIPNHFILCYNGYIFLNTCIDGVFTFGSGEALDCRYDTNISCIRLIGLGNKYMIAYTPVNTNKLIVDTISFSSGNPIVPVISKEDYASDYTDSSFSEALSFRGTGQGSRFITWCEPVHVDSQEPDIITNVGSVGGVVDRLNEQTLLGILQEGGIAGDEKPVATKFTQSIIHDGLAVGYTYYFDTDGSITNNKTAYVIGKAISPTSILVEFNNEQSVSSLAEFPDSFSNNKVLTTLNDEIVYVEPGGVTQPWLAAYGEIEPGNVVAFSSSGKVVKAINTSGQALLPVSETVPKHYASNNTVAIENNNSDYLVSVSQSSYSGVRLLMLKDNSPDYYTYPLAITGIAFTLGPYAAVHNIPSTDKYIVRDSSHIFIISIVDDKTLHCYSSLSLQGSDPYYALSFNPHDATEFSIWTASGLSMYTIDYDTWVINFTSMNSQVDLDITGIEGCVCWTDSSSEILILARARTSGYPAILNTYTMEDGIATKTSSYSPMLKVLRSNCKLTKLTTSPHRYVAVDTDQGHIEQFTIIDGVVQESLKSINPNTISDGYPLLFISPTRDIVVVATNTNGKSCSATFTPNATDLTTTVTNIVSNVSVTKQNVQGHTCQAGGYFYYSTAYRVYAGSFAGDLVDILYDKVIGIADKVSSNGDMVRVATEGLISTANTSLQPAKNYGFEIDGSIAIDGTYPLGLALASNQLRVNLMNPKLNGTTLTNSSAGQTALDFEITYNHVIDLTTTINLAAPLNRSPGGRGTIKINQPAGGFYQVSFSNVFLFANGITPNAPSPERSLILDFVILGDYTLLCSAFGNVAATIPLVVNDMAMTVPKLMESEVDVTSESTGVDLKAVDVGAGTIGNTRIEDGKVYYNAVGAGSDSFGFTIQDKYGQVGSATANITVSADNIAPIVTGKVQKVTAVDTLISIAFTDILNYAHDLENQVITVDGASDQVNCTYTVEASSIDVTPSSSYTGLATLNAVISDSEAATSLVPIEIDVGGTVLDDVTAASIVTAYDLVDGRDCYIFDYELIENGTATIPSSLRVTGVTATSNCTVEIESYGIYKITPTTNTGSATLSYTLSDGNTSATNTITMNIRGAITIANTELGDGTMGTTVTLGNSSNNYWRALTTNTVTYGSNPS